MARRIEYISRSTGKLSYNERFWSRKTDTFYSLYATVRYVKVCLTASDGIGSTKTVRYTEAFVTLGFVISTFVVSKFTLRHLTAVVLPSVVVYVEKFSLYVVSDSIFRLVS